MDRIGNGGKMSDNHTKVDEVTCEQANPHKILNINIKTNFLVCHQRNAIYQKKLCQKIQKETLFMQQRN